MHSALGRKNIIGKRHLFGLYVVGILKRGFHQKFARARLRLAGNIKNIFVFDGFAAIKIFYVGYYAALKIKRVGSAKRGSVFGFVVGSFVKNRNFNSFG